MNKIDELWNEFGSLYSNMTDGWDNIMKTKRLTEQFKAHLDHDSVEEKENKKMKVVTVKFLGSAREYDY